MHRGDHPISRPKMSPAIRFSLAFREAKFEPSSRLYIEEAMSEHKERPFATVVHLKIKGGKVVQDCDEYIGRAQNQGGWKLSTSIWANDHPVKACKSVDDACRRFEIDLRKNKVLLSKIPELCGKRLGCWCIGKTRCSTCGELLSAKKCSHYQCHGEVIVKIGEELRLGEEQIDPCPQTANTIANDDCIGQTLASPKLNPRLEGVLSGISPDWMVSQHRQKRAARKSQIPCRLTTPSL